MFHDIIGKCSVPKQGVLSPESPINRWNIQKAMVNAIYIYLRCHALGLYNGRY